MAAPQRLTRLKPVFVQNRKYIGSKYHLLDFIAGVVTARAPHARSFADPFCGSAVVASHFAARGMRVIAADILYHNYLAARCFLGSRPGQVQWSRIEYLLEELDALQPDEGYCFHEFGGSYFTLPNAGRIDAIRERIARWRAMAAISEQEHAILLTSLIYAADKVANTCGQYDAFLKHLGASSYAEDGTHRVDAMVYRPLQLGLPQALEPESARILCGDATQLIEQISADVLYLDPPYNSRQYVDNYHVLENIALWKKPELFGKTRKFARDHLRSAYSSKRTAPVEMTRLIARARAKHILLSYNNEGIVPDGEILGALERRGPVEVYTQEYAIFGNGAGRSVRRPITERLFYCRVLHPPELQIPAGGPE